MSFNQLKNKELNEECKAILIAYLFEDTLTWLEAHNALIKYGIYLTENDTIIDY